MFCQMWGWGSDTNHLVPTMVADRQISQVKTEAWQQIDINSAMKSFTLLDVDNQVIAKSEVQAQDRGG